MPKFAKLHPYYSDIIADEKEYEGKWGDLKSTISPDFVKKCEELAATRLSLPIVYDIIYAAPGYFPEYRYTDALGGVYVSTVSQEANCRIVLSLTEETNGFDACEYIRSTTKDKYELNTATYDIPKLAILPGSNLDFVVDHDRLSRLMVRHEDMFIKPHPLTNEKLLRFLVSHYGRNRVLDPHENTSFLLTCAEKVYSCSTSSTVLQAVAHGVPVENIGRFFYESRGTFYAITRLLFEMSEEGATSGELQYALNRAMGSVESGWLLPSMNDLEERLDKYHELSLNVREVMKPIAAPYKPIEAK